MTEPMRFLFRCRSLTLLAAAATLLLATGCDDDTPTDEQDTTLDTATDGTTDGDVPEDTAADTGPDDTDQGDDADAVDGDDGADVPDGDAPDVVDVVDVDVPECPASCPANMVCNAPEAGCVCGQSFADCDNDTESNGCETDISVPEQCGACGEQRDPVCFFFGVAQNCSYDDETMRHSCPRVCASGHYDLDDDLLFENDSDGCETGVVRRGPSAAQDLSASLGTGNIVALDHDGATLFALTESSGKLSVHAIGVDVDGTATVIDSLATNRNVGANGRPNFAVHEGLIAVSQFGQTGFIAFDGTELTDLGAAPANGASSVDVLSAPLVANAQAEFISAVTDGIAWYGVFAQESDAPATATCFSGGRVCELATSTLPPNAMGITVGSLGGVPWAITLGDLTFEHGFDASTPELVQSAAGGATIPTDALDLDVLTGDRLAVVQDDGVHVYTYTLSATNKPQTRTDSYTVAPSAGTATDLAVLDEQRVLLATDQGLLAVWLDGTAQSPQATLTQPLTSIDAVAVGAGWAFAASGQSLVTFELDLMPIE